MFHAVKYIMNKQTPCAIYGNGTGGVCLYQMILCVCAGLSP